MKNKHLLFFGYSLAATLFFAIITVFIGGGFDLHTFDMPGRCLIAGFYMIAIITIAILVYSKEYF